MEGPLRVGRSGGRLGFVKNVVCSSVGTVAASVRLLYIHFRSLYVGNHSTYSLCTTAGKKLCHGTLGEFIALSLAVCSCKSLLHLERVRSVIVNLL